MTESAGANAGISDTGMHVFQTIPEYSQPGQKIATSSLSKRSKSLNRKTSAEIVQEAKNMLANTTPAHSSTRSYSSMSTLKFEGTFKGTGKSKLNQSILTCDLFLGSSCPGGRCELIKLIKFVIMIDWQCRSLVPWRLAAIINRPPLIIFILMMVALLRLSLVLLESWNN